MFETAVVGGRKGDPKVLPCRQQLEAEDPSAFLPFEELVAMFEAVSKFMTAENAKLPVISASYCWEGANHPDPEGRLLVSIAEKLNNFLAKSNNCWVSKNFAHGYADFGVFLDWCSVHQKPRSAAEDCCFKRALRGMNLLYAHRLVQPLIVEEQDAFLEKPRAVRGWPVFEEAMSFLLKDQKRVVGGHQAVPLPSAEFSLKLDSLHFTNGADRGMVAELYERALADAWAENKNLLSAASGEDLATLGRCLVEVGCPMLEEVCINDDFDATTPGIDALFDGLSLGHKLRSLKINAGTNHMLRHLPDSIGQLRALQELTLSECKELQELPASIGSLQSLQVLSIPKCTGLKELPASICNLQSLQKLDVGECGSLQELPASFGNLQSLQTLVLKQCDSLKELPASIGNLQSLEMLDMSQCTSLQELPASIGSLQSLQDLDMNRCTSLKELPTSLGDLKALKELNLCGCYGIQELPASFGNLTSLQGLWLKFCGGLQELPASFGDLTSLTTLNLNSCKNLQELPASFGNLKSLQELHVATCKSLQEIPQSVAEIEGLETVELWDCPAKENFERMRAKR